MDALYIEAEQNDDGFILPIYSAISVFSFKFVLTSSYESCPIKLYLVSGIESDKEASGLRAIQRIPKECLDFATVIKKADVPVSILRCQLPVLSTHKGLMIHSGLCTVLRTLIIQLDSVNPDLKMMEILGFRAMCLKSCAEVSVWTKFCEIQVPQLVTRLANENESNATGEQPHAELLHLEEHFFQPPVIPNINKRKRKLDAAMIDSKESTKVDSRESRTLQNGQTNGNAATSICDTMYREIGTYVCMQSKKDSGGDSIDKSELQSAVKSLRLHHVFAEGADFTLTDVILFPCVSMILDSYGENNTLFDKLPNVCAWYNRLRSTTRFQRAAHNSHIVLRDIEIPYVSISSESSKSPKENESKLVKKKVKVNTNDALPLINRIEKSGIDLTQDGHPCAAEKVDWDSAPRSVHPSQGSLPDKRVNRKCEQLENLAVAVRSIASPGDVLVDFCAGGGHLGIVIAYLRPDCQVLMVENKQESIRRAVDRVKAANLTNVTLYQSNLDYFTGHFDIGTCLHACGVATDLVLAKCRDVTASFVVCPCCYGSIQEAGGVRYPRSALYRELGFSYQEYLLLARAADDRNSGKPFMTAVDKDRGSAFQELGYTVTLCSLQPLSCSPKNNMLIGVKK